MVAGPDTLTLERYGRGTHHRKRGERRGGRDALSAGAEAISQSGRALGSSLPLQEAGIALEHCVVRPAAGGYRVIDRHSGSGTYVNGLRVMEQALIAEDEISIGETTLVFREAVAERESDARHTLLQACGLLFLFRAIALGSR